MTHLDPAHKWPINTQVHLQAPSVEEHLYIESMHADPGLAELEGTLERSSGLTVEPLEANATDWLIPATRWRPESVQANYRNQSTQLKDLITSAQNSRPIFSVLAKDRTRTIVHKAHKWIAKFVEI